MLRLVKQPVSLFSFALLLLAIPFWWHFYRPMPALAFMPPAAELNVKLIRAGLDARALAAAGVTSNGVSMLAADASTYLGDHPNDLTSADSSYASARRETDRLQRLIQSGQASAEDISSYQSQSAALATATTQRQAALDGLFNAATASLSQGQKTSLSTIRANRLVSDASIEFLTVNRSQQEWVQLRDDLANERIAIEYPDTLDQNAQSQLSTWRAVEAVSTAKTNLDTNLAAVTAAWNSATGG